MITDNATRLVRAALMAVAVAAVSLALPGAASAGQFGSQYSYVDSGCNDVSDPINAVFFGTGSNDYLVRSGKGHIYYHTGWTHHTYPAGKTEGESYYGAGSLGCLPSLTFQPAEAPGPFHSRYHVRRFAASAGNGWKDAHGNDVTLATPHHEDWVQGCSNGTGNHAVDKGAVDRGSEWETDKGSGFDRGRRKLRVRFSKDPRGGVGRHKIFNAYWGNTRSKKQCDGDWAGGDGNVAWIGVGRVRG